MRANCGPTPGRFSTYFEWWSFVGSGYTSCSSVMSRSRSPGRRVVKKSVKSWLVLPVEGTKDVPSLVLYPVRMETLCHLPAFQASIGRVGIMPPLPSMTGWKGHRTEGLYRLKIASEAVLISDVLYPRSVVTRRSSGTDSQPSSTRNSLNCFSWSGLEWV